ncbi:MAG: hypothetical protein ACOC06_05230 [Halorubrum sp.]
MGITDDTSDRHRSDGDTDGRHAYRTDRIVREDGRLLGEVDGERFREVLLRHPDACEAFRIISGAGYRDPAEAMGTYSAAEHAGRVESDVRSVAADVKDGYACVVRLDTADPQLATVRNRVARAEVEFDTERVRWIPPEAAERSGG